MDLLRIYVIIVNMQTVTMVTTSHPLMETQCVKVENVCYRHSESVWW